MYVWPMNNVIYSKRIENTREEVGETDATLYLTHENNGYAIFLREETTWSLVCYFPEAMANRAVEVAVKYGAMTLPQLRSFSPTEIYPNPSC